MSVAEFKGRTETGYTASGVSAYTFVIGATTANTQKKISTSGAGGIAIGIACDTYTAGSDAAYVVDGPAKLKVDGSGTAITAGLRLKSDSTGRGVVAGASDPAYARAVGVSVAANDVIDVIYGDC